MVLACIGSSLFYLHLLPNFLCLRLSLQFSMTKRTSPPLLNKDFFHHSNQFAIIQNLLDDMGMGLSIIFTVRKTALSAHLSTPLECFIKLLYSFGKRMPPTGKSLVPNNSEPISTDTPHRRNVILSSWPISICSEGQANKPACWH